MKKEEEGEEEEEEEKEVSLELSKEEMINTFSHLPACVYNWGLLLSV